MFNGSRFNGSAYNAGGGGVRVLLASAVLAVSSAGSAEPLRTQYGNADAPVASVISEPRAVAERAGESRVYPEAIFDVSRPWDLATAGMLAATCLEPEHLVIRAGLASLDGDASLSVASIRYAFFSSLLATAEFDAVAPTAMRPGVSQIDGETNVAANATRAQPGESALQATVLATVDGQTLAGGVAALDVTISLFAEPHINGEQPGWSALETGASLTINGDRLAGSVADGQIGATFEASALPGRGALVDEALVTAELTAVWWAFNYESSTLTVSAAIEANPTKTAAAASQLDAETTGQAIWSLIVEPRKSVVMSDATLSATPWRIRHASAYADVNSTARAKPYRIYLLSVDLTALGSAMNVRHSINLTNPAPLDRQMAVPREARAMMAPAENRIMVVF